MGHDTSGYRLSAPKDEIAYLRRACWNPLNRTIYEALGAEDCGGDLSGYGVGKIFTQQQLTDALANIPGGDEYEPERQFLRDCIATGEAKILIRFC